MLTNPALINLLHQRLAQSPEGVDEYSLLTELKAQGLTFDYSDTGELFRYHFILFHHLYHLQQQLGGSTESLLINVSRIQLRPRQQKNTGDIDEVDSVAKFYLDARNLETDEKTLSGWIDQFWLGFVFPDELEQAWQTLQLQPVSDLGIVKKQYRKLSMQHHPDRGGDTEKFQQIQQAMQVLAKHLVSPTATC